MTTEQGQEGGTSTPSGTPDPPAISAVDAGLTAGGDASIIARGSAAGRDFTQTIYNYLSRGPEEAAVAEERRREAEQRARLIRRVGMQYAHALDQTRRGAPVHVDLTFRAEPSLVRKRLDEIVPRDTTTHDLAAGTSIGEVLKACEESGDGRLLILGGPGAGKSSLLLELAAERAEAAAEAEGEMPIPVIVPLSAWANYRHALRQRLAWRRGARTQLEAFLADQLSDLYSIGSSTATRWLEMGKVMLLLDGLDEILDPVDREACVSELNTFLAGKPTKVVVCCRAPEYTSLDARLEFDDAVTVGDLTSDMLLRSLHGAAYAGLRHALHADPGLVDLCASPLFLGIVSVAYSGLPAEAVASSDGDDLRARLFEDYLRRALADGDPSDRDGLVRLARAQVSTDDTVFLLEHLQPSWLPWGCHVAALIPAGIAAWIGWQLAGWLDVVLFGVAVLAALTVGYSTSAPLIWSLRPAVAPAALLGGACLGAVMGLGLAMLRKDIVSEVSLRPLDVRVPTLVGGPMVGLLIGALVLGIFHGFSAGAIRESAAPGEGLRVSLRTSLIVGALVFVGTVAACYGTVWILDVGEMVSATHSVIHTGSQLGDMCVATGVQLVLVITYIWGGLTALIGYPWVRFGLAVSGRAPLRYRRWLERMVDLRILYRTGPGYVFVHGLLRLHLAQTDVHDQGRPSEVPVEAGPTA